MTKPSDLRTGSVSGSGTAVPQTSRHSLSDWERQFSDAPILNLPIDKARRTTPAPRYLWRSSPLSNELSQPLRELCQAEQVPLSTALLGAFQVLLLRYCGQTDLLLGCRLPDQAPTGKNGSSPHFVEFALRTDLSADP